MKKWIPGLLVAALLMGGLMGCASQEGSGVTVQSVAEITGMGSVGLIDRFAGVVSARSEVKVAKEEQRTVSDIYVSAGDTVTEGQKLFAYDIEESQLALEKAQLEKQKIEDSIAALEKQKTELEEQLEKAKDADKLNYTLEIQTCDTNIRESRYNLALQEKEVQRLQKAVEGYEILSPIAGRIQTVNAEGGTDQQGNPLPLITIMEEGAYRVKGQVNEVNANDMVVGTPVLVRSRVHAEETWSGTIALIDWENPVTSNNNRYVEGGGDEMTTTSKYPFYVELNSDEGLLLGQHVYIEPDWGQEEEASGLWLPAYYLFDLDGTSARVWARDGRGKLESRELSLGEYNEELDSYEILSGLAAEDYIAFPGEDCKVGAPTTEFDESAFEVSEEGMTENFGEMPEGEFMGEGAYEGGVISEGMPMEEGEGSVDGESLPQEMPMDETADETGTMPAEETVPTEGAEGAEG